jgi:hypothetical protein
MPAFGVMRGIVAANADPQAKGRLRVSLPLVESNSSVWADVCVSSSTAPSFPVGSVVVVAFENGDMNRPIVLGRI